MPDNSRIDLAQYRMTKADECFRADGRLLEEGLFADSANRSYYAIFHAIRAILALDERDFKKHSGVISYFQQQYVKTGTFDKEYSDIARGAFHIRQESDYEDFFLVSEQDASEQLENAGRFIDAVKEYLKTR